MFLLTQSTFVSDAFLKSLQLLAKFLDATFAFNPFDDENDDDDDVDD